jgi:P27 family predicted phage terminase small subunit
MASPRPKLAAMKQLEGNPGRRKIVEESGIVGLGEPELIEKLCERADKCFEDVKKHMPPAIYAKLDTYLLSAYAMCWAILMEAKDHIFSAHHEWIVMNSAGSLTESPWIKMQMKQSQLLASLGDRLGLDPKSRAGLHLAQEPKKSKFDGLIGQISQSGQNV